MRNITETPVYILGIESSCDDTSAAIISNTTILSNIVAGQKVHEAYGGVVPELASRAHQQNIIPVVDMAIKHERTEYWRVKCDNCGAYGPAVSKLFKRDDAIKAWNDRRV